MVVQERALLTEDREDLVVVLRWALIPLQWTPGVVPDSQHHAHQGVPYSPPPHCGGIPDRQVNVNFFTFILSLKETVA